MKDETILFGAVGIILTVLFSLLIYIQVENKKNYEAFYSECRELGGLMLDGNKLVCVKPDSILLIR